MWNGPLIILPLFVNAATGGLQGADIWNVVFAEQKLTKVAAIPPPSWPEGPQPFRGGIIFSDTVRDVIFRYNSAEGLTELRKGVGEAPAGAASWMAEPGPNGIAVDPDRLGTAYVCQHGRHGISRLDLTTLELEPLVSEFNGTRLNGPNDIVLDRHSQRLYFTDPIYAYLEKHRLRDSEYVDEACARGLGFTGVFRMPVGGRPEDLELLDGAGARRPNGIALSPGGSRLYVSECCQGEHLPNCTQGDAHYLVYRVGGRGAELERRVSFRIPPPGGARGCADGFKVHPGTGLIVGSCPGGICVVGAGAAEEAGASPAAAAPGMRAGLLARLELRHKVSNVAFAPDGFMYATGEDAGGGGALYRVPLRRERPPRGDELRR